MTAVAPDISVVIPVHNGAGTLPALLDSLAQQSLARERFEVIVVDNASTDATAAIAERAAARVVAEPHPNRALARNRGVEVARAHRIAFTDADCVATPDWLAALERHVWGTPLVAGEVLVTTTSNPNAIERFERLWRFGQEAWVQQGWAATANLAIEREVFEKLGGFDTTWSHIGEDVDLCWRARGAGFGLEFCPDAIVEHDADRELGEFLKRAFRHGYSTTQAHYRLGVGHRPWRAPAPLLSGSRALGFYGQAAQSFQRSERRRLGLVARASYAARLAGSAWAEVKHAR
jgi:GT2 family glycosyltransferase